MILVLGRERFVMGMDSMQNSMQGAKASSHKSLACCRSHHNLFIVFFGLDICQVWTVYS
jgi:hypothetical protein